jgi:hypothetical protein
MPEHGGAAALPKIEEARPALGVEAESAGASDAGKAAEESIGVEGINHPNLSS